MLKGENMSEAIKDKKQEIPRTPDTTYTEYLEQDSQKVPDFMVEESFEELGSEDIDINRYISKEFFEKESECMWTRVWQFACRVEDIPEVGDNLVYDILDWSFIIVRSEEDKIQAFYNSCLHRGRRIKTERSFSKDLECPFHGFCWNLDGSLKRTPAPWDFQHIKDREFNLPEVRLEIWQGFVFINMDDNAQVMINFNNGAKGMFWTSVMARGGVYGLRIRVFGSKGSLEWVQNDPNYLKLNPEKGAVKLLERGFHNSEFSKQFSRIKFGHPEGYLDAFANIYKEFADSLKNKTKKRYFYPNEDEGLETAKFISACKISSRRKRWVKI